MGQLAVGFLVACGASKSPRAEAIGTALHEHRVWFSGYAGQRLVAGNMAVQATRMPKHDRGFPERLE